MWKALFLAAAFTVSMSPVDARQPSARNDRVEDRVEKRHESGELRRDVERISKEIYPPRSDSASSRRSFAAGTALKKR
jgi:hypothetical protein